MASTVLSTAATRIADDLFKVSYLAQSAIPEGAVVVYGATDDEVILPTAANSLLIAGVAMSAGPLASTGISGNATAGTDRVDVQKLGRARVLLAAGQTVTRGQVAVIANTSGHVQARAAYGTSAGILGLFAQSKTAGANAEFVEVDLAIRDVEVADGIVGQSITAIGAATKYLVAAGTDAAAAAARVLFVCPSAGVLRTLIATATTAAGGADTGIVTVYRNPWGGATYGGFAATALTATLAAAGAPSFFIADTTHIVAVAQGDLIAIQVVSSGTTLAGVNASVLFT